MSSSSSDNKPLPLPIRHWSPKRVFLSDAIGALLTAAILGLGLVRLHTYLGMPLNILYTLAGIALGFSAYSLSMYLLKPPKWVPFLRIIALANMAYVLLTLSLLYSLRKDVTAFALVYFIGEALLVLGIAYMEWSYARRCGHKAFADLGAQFTITFLVCAQPWLLT